MCGRRGIIKVEGTINSHKRVNDYFHLREMADFITAEKEN